MKAENLKRNKLGRFVPVYKIWSLDNFDEGYASKDNGRFMVRLPDHHRAHKDSWVYRAIVAFEAYWDVKVTIDFAVHHIDENKLNDSISNLQLMKKGDHIRFHKEGVGRNGVNDHLKMGSIIKCLNCGKEVYKKKYMIEGSKNNFCSRKCKYEYGVEIRICAFCNADFKIRKSMKQKFCSVVCYKTSRKLGV